MPSSFLLSLPRELRNMIYETYVWSNEGYAYNHKTNKILRADGNHIELSLSLTCRQIAYEMSGLALHYFDLLFGEHAGIGRSVSCSHSDNLLCANQITWTSST
jgi:hypothetical protein